MSDLMISGVIEGGLANGRLKAVELTVINDIDDLSAYGLGFGLGSGGSGGQVFTFPDDAVSAGDKIYVALEMDAFTSFFGFAPTYISFFFANVNGENAIELFQSGAVLDVFGNVGVNGDPADAEDEGWDYTDGWVVRSAIGPNATFDVTDWDPNPGELIDASNNAEANTPFPVAAIYLIESDSNTEISEGGVTDTYDVVLNTQPSDTVVVTVTPDAQTDLGNGAGQPLLLTFTPTNYNQPQTITVTTFDDGDPGNNASRIITHVADSNDPSYSSATNNNLILNFDNLDAPAAIVPDTISDAGVTITESAGGTIVTESGSVIGSYDITLDSVPTAPVTITITPDAQTNLGNGGGTAITLLFNPGDASLTQTVMVTAVDDGTGEGEHVSVITHSATSTDPNYNTADGLAIADVTATVLETGITITPLSADPILEGETATYNVILNSIPTDTVTVTIDPNIQTNLGLGDGFPIELIFDPDDNAFSLSQEVTVEAVTDVRVEGDHTSTLTHSTESNDPNYNDLTIADVVVNISDAGISITDVTQDSVPEGSTTTYNITLNTTPTEPVTVTLKPDAQTDVGNGAGMEFDVTIDPNVSLTEVVTVTVISDTDDEGTHQSIISHTSSSADSSYDNLTIDAVTINITDPGISIVETGGGTTVSETGITDQYEIVLSSVPSGTLTVTVDPDDQTDVGNGPGVAKDFQFGPTVLSQTVTVTANADGILEGTHSSAISHSVSASNALEYPVENLSTVNATIIDCFLTGTQLLTDKGEKRVEELKIGDRLQTLDGSLEKIKWIGIQTCYTNGHNHPLRTYPICVKAGALGPNCPIRDLYVSPDHALLVEGILVNAGALENGDSIVQIQPTDETFVYYHIELEQHNILIADGAPAESYLPQKQDRNTFDNGDEYAEMYPHRNMQALVPMSYPRVSSKRQLPRFIAKYIAQQWKPQPFQAIL